MALIVFIYVYLQAAAGTLSAPSSKPLFLNHKKLLLGAKFIHVTGLQRWAPNFAMKAKVDA